MIEVAAVMKQFHIPVIWVKQQKSTGNLFIFLKILCRLKLFDALDSFNNKYISHAEV